VAFNVKLKNIMDYVGYVGNLADSWLGCRAGFRGAPHIQLIIGPTTLVPVGSCSKFVNLIWALGHPQP